MSDKQAGIIRENARYHRPVLLNETIQYLDPQPGDQFIDATFGFGGHSFRLLECIQPGGAILAFEWDPQIVAIMKKELMKNNLDKKINLRNKNFSQIKRVAQKEGFMSVKGIIFDLGVSNWHFKQAKRGFSFQQNEPLDMRINPNQIKLTAFEVVNYFSESQLTEVFKNYGEESASRRIAKEIVQQRKQKKIETTEDLAEIVLRAKGGNRNSKIHPSTKVFMALRSFINGELDNLKQGLQGGYDLLQPGGKIVVLSFQGLEDVVIKQIFRNLKKLGAKVLTKNVVRPTASEVNENPSARSAKLRALMKPVNQ